MKAKKLLKRLSEFLHADEGTAQQDIKAIKKILKALKIKETDLKARLQATDNADEALALQTKLDVIYAQRTKGVEKVKLLQRSERTDDHDTKAL